MTDHMKEIQELVNEKRGGYFRGKGGEQRLLAVSNGVIVVGGTGTGKTRLVKMLLDGEFKINDETTLDVRITSDDMYPYREEVKNPIVTHSSGIVGGYITTIEDLYGIYQQRKAQAATDQLDNKQIVYVIDGESLFIQDAELYFGTEEYNDLCNKRRQLLYDGYNYGIKMITVENKKPGTPTYVATDRRTVIQTGQRRTNLHGV